jgi:hypothetical protein
MNQQTLFAEPKPPAAPKAATPSKPPIKKLRLLSVPRFTRRPRGIVAQTRAALRPGNRLATLLGCVLGAFVPTATFFVAHGELDASRPLWRQFGSLLVAGGLAYSATNVFAWGRLAFRSPVKAAGFVVLLEGVLVGSRTHWLSLAALAVLAGINALATGAILSTENGE